MFYQSYNSASPNNYGLGTDIASPQDYLSTVNQAFQNLGQAPNDNNRQDITNEYIRNLSSSFVNRFHQQTGQVPTVDQVRQFVSQNATQGNAMKYVQGQLTPDQMDTMSDQHLQSNPNTANQAQQDPAAAMKSYTDSLQGFANQQYDTGAQALQNSVQDAYLPAKQGLVEDQAAQNALGNANSRHSLNALEATKNRNLSEGLTNLAGQRAQTMSGLGSQGAQLGLQSQSIANQAKQYGQSLGLANRQFQNQQDIQSQNLGLMNRQLNMAGQVGRAQAGAQSNNGLMGGLSGAGTGALIGTSIAPGIGTGIGAFAGGLAGYFGSRS